MPRKRQVDPSFFDDELMVSLPVEACLLYQGLWTRADDAWNVEDSPGQWFIWFFGNRHREGGEPYTREDVTRWRSHLVTAERLLLYSVNGKSFCHLPKMETHQVVNHPSKPRCPPPPDTFVAEHSLRATVVISEDSLTTPLALPQSRGGRGELSRTEMKRTEGIEKNGVLLPIGGSEEAKELWESALKELKPQVSRANFHAWLQETTGEALEGDTLLVRVPNNFYLEWLEKRMMPHIRNTLVGLAERPLQVRFTYPEGGIPPSPPFEKGGDGDTE